MEQVRGELTPTPATLIVPVGYRPWPLLLSHLLDSSEHLQWGSTNTTLELSNILQADQPCLGSENTKVMVKQGLAAVELSFPCSLWILGALGWACVTHETDLNGRTA